LRGFLPEGRLFAGVDAENPERVAEVLRTVAPDVVLNCGGVIKQKREAHHALPSIRINALFPHQLAALASERGAKLIHWSTDCVFSGARGGYTEADNPDPVDLYGRSKLLGEVSEAPHLTIRSSLIGRELEPTASGLVEWFLAQRGKEIAGFAKARFSGLTTFAMCRLVKAVLTRCPELSGVYHVASEPIGKYDLLSRLNARIGAPIRIRRDDTFACDRSLDGSRFAKETGIAVPSWDEMLEPLAAELATYDAWRAAEAR
jgi:dTDP-4-dehydrorhamnose reductase